MNLLPRKSLSNLDIQSYAKTFKIPYFRGVYMRDDLPYSGPLKNESAIVNLDSNAGPGTHWVAYKKRDKVLIYFDSYGDLPPPAELIIYLYKGRSPIREVYYNYKRYQKFDTVLCGHFCLQFLLPKKNEFKR